MTKVIDPGTITKEAEEADQPYTEAAIKTDWEGQVSLAEVAADPNFEFPEEPTGDSEIARSPPQGTFSHPLYHTHETTVPLAGRGSKAEEEHLWHPANVSAIEEFRARGFAKIKGVHIMADGLVSKKGYRRVTGIPDDREMLDVETARELAEKVLHGRNATIYSRCVIDHADGLRGATEQQMARQFGISVSQVYRIIGKCQMRMVEAQAEIYRNLGQRKPETNPHWSTRISPMRLNTVRQTFIREAVADGMSPVEAELLSHHAFA